MNTAWHELIQRHIAGLTTDAEAEQLQSLLRTDEAAARLYLRYMNLDVALEAHAGSRAAISEMLRAPLEPQFRKRSRWLSWRPLTAAAAMLLLCGLAVHLILENREMTSQVRLESSNSNLEVVREGRRLSASTKMPLLVGDEIFTSSAEDAADVIFPDGTRIILTPGTHFIPHRLHGQKILELCAGSLWADVAKQPAGHPLKFITPQGTATVVGTQLRLSVEMETTRMEVMEGAVRMKPSVAGEMNAEKVVVAGGRIVLGSTSSDTGAGNATAADKRFIELAHGEERRFDFAEGHRHWDPTSETHWQAEGHGAQGVMVLEGNSAYKLLGPTLRARAGDRFEMTLRVLAESDAVLAVRYYVFEHAETEPKRRTIVVPWVKVPPVPKDGQFHDITLHAQVAEQRGGTPDSIAFILYVYRENWQQPRREDRLIVDSISIRRL